MIILIICQKIYNIKAILFFMIEINFILYLIIYINHLYYLKIEIFNYITNQ